MIPPLITISIIKSISFSVYENTKYQLRTYTSIDGSTIPSLVQLTFTSGAVSGGVIALLSCPLELVKIQRQLEQLMMNNQSYMASKVPPEGKKNGKVLRAITGEA